MIIRFILFTLFGSGAFAGLGLLTRQFNWPAVVNSMTAIPLSPWILLIAVCGLLCGYSACVVRKRSGPMLNTLGSFVGVAIVGAVAACFEMSEPLSGGNVIFIFLAFLGLLFASMLTSLFLPANR